jgi:hypothetical protein
MSWRDILWLHIWGCPGGDNTWLSARVIIPGNSREKHILSPATGKLESAIEIVLSGFL